MKKWISLFLIAAICSGFMGAVPVSRVAAAESITDEDLFMTYPAYLSNSDIDEATSKAEAACYKVLNSYTESDQAVAVVMSALSEGISVRIRDALSKFGLTESLYETYLIKAAKKYMQAYLSNDDALAKATKKVTKAYKTLKSSYSAAESVTKEMLLTDLRKLAAENDISLSIDGMDKVVKKLYGSDQFKKDLDAVGEAMDLWQAVLEMTELAAIELSSIDFLMEELAQAGGSDSDLYRGLQLLKSDIEKSPDVYVLKVYGTKKVLSYLSKNIEKFSYGLTDAPASTIALVKAFAKFYADYIYADAKADQIVQSTIHMSFISSIDVCLSRYRLKFMQGKGTANDIETYKSLFGCSMAAYAAACSSCYDCAKLNDKFSLGGDCKIWEDDFKYYYHYDNYVRWCKETIQHDISDSTLDQGTGTSTITDALNEETIRARLEKIYTYYTPNADKVWNSSYEGAKGAMGFVSLVFNRIFDKKLSTKADSRYEYILTNEANVRLIGRLEEGNVTAAALKELFHNARVGDIILSSGKDRYIHAMALTGIKENAVEVYDCDSKFYKADAKPFEIRKYDFTYADMANSFNTHGKYNDKAGISVYRAIQKVNPTNSGSSLYYGEEYDDSVNFVIEDGVLKSYTGSRTTIEIPEGVTQIGEECFKQKNIKYVYMPDTVTEIGYAAFAFCENLQYVDLSDNLTEIHAAAFQGCASLRNIILPNSLRCIWGYAFYDSALMSIDIPDNVEIIEWHAFEDCVNLTTITVGQKVRRLYDSTFAGCVNLKTVYWNTSKVGDYGDAFQDAGKDSGGFNVIFGDNVTFIPDNALSGSHYLTNVVIPDSVTSIGKEAFKFCDALQSITIPENVSYIGSGAFGFCDGLETVYWNAVAVKNFSEPNSVFWNALYGRKKMRVIFGSSVKSIPAYALAGYDWISEIIIGENVISIGDEAFFRCGITDLIIPDSVTTLSNSAVDYCSKLVSLTLPAVWDSWYFPYGLDNLNNVYISDKNEYFESMDGVLYAKDAAKTLVYVPAARTELCIPVDCRQVENGPAFRDAVHIKNITVAGGNTYLSTIDGNLYNDDATQLIKYAPGKSETAFHVPQSVITIGYMAFENSANLSKIIVPDSVEYIEVGAFQNCANLEAVVLSENLSILSDFLFSSSGIKNITVPKAVTKIGEYAFQSCRNLESIHIPASVHTIKVGAFRGCDTLTDVYFDGTIEDWQKISIGADNESLLHANIHVSEPNPDDEQLEKMEYAYQIVAGVNSWDEIDVWGFSVGDTTYFEVYSKNYAGKYALMDSRTGKLVLDNLDEVGRLSAYSDLIFTTIDAQKVIYNLETKSVVCELDNFDGLQYGGHFSTEGGFVMLASDKKLHFITNDGVVGNAVNIEHSQYTDGNKHLMTWSYLGEDLFQLGVGNAGGLFKTIGIVQANGEILAYVDSVDKFTDGLAVVRKDNLYGVIDRYGNFILPCVYDKLTYSDQTKKFTAVQNDAYYEMDSNGKVISMFKPDFNKYDGVKSYLGNGFAIVYNKASAYFDWKYGVVDSDNSFIIPITYAEIYSGDGFSEDMCSIGLSESFMGTSVYGYLDKTGKIAIPFEYESAGVFSEGFAAVSKNGKYGYIDIEGNVRIPFDYTYGEVFSEGFAAVSKNGKYGYIDIDGNVVIPFEYAAAEAFSGGVAEVAYDFYSPSFFINPKNEIVSASQDEKLFKYTLTGTFDWEAGRYVGDIKNNETGEIVNWAYPELIPWTDGNEIVAFTSDFLRAYRMTWESCMPKTEITDFTVDRSGEVHISVANVPAGSSVLVASYDKAGRLLELQKLILSNDKASAVFSTEKMEQLKAFVWNDHFKPFSESKTCELTKESF